MPRITTLFALFAAAVPAIAQEAGSTPKEAPKAPFVVEAGEVAIPALVDRCAAHLACNILWDPRELVGTGAPPLRLQQRVETDRDGCLEFLAEHLHRAGFALTWANEKNRTLEAIAMHGPRGREVLARAAVRSEQDVLARPTLRMPVAVTLPLQHINAVMATNALRPYFASTAGTASSLTLGVLGDSGSLVLSGMQDQVAQAIRLLREADKPRAGAPAPADITKRLEELERRVQALEARLAESTKAK